ncbi:MAG: hypothetical protein ACI4VF_08970 [Lachnospirales bacterium]
MSCFIVPAVEAVVTTVVKKSCDKVISEDKNMFVDKLSWLNNMLWGGSALLLFEHIWHGEVTPWFPFLTSALDPVDKANMIKEMATAGVFMAVLVTALWALMVVAVNVISNSKESIKG